MARIPQWYRRESAAIERLRGELSMAVHERMAYGPARDVLAKIKRLEEALRLAEARLLGLQALEESEHGT